MYWKPSFGNGSCQMVDQGDSTNRTPANNPLLLGHDQAKESFMSAWSENRLPHAWLISGPQGIGKATFCYACARALLAETSPQDNLGLSLGLDDGSSTQALKSFSVSSAHPIFGKVASGSHPDLMVVSPGVNPRTGKQRQEILVDDIRALSGFLSLTAGESLWRVAIIDSADSLNRNAANALLKLLEEPPKQTVLMLVSHSPGRLLPTIRSRCRKLPLGRLSSENVSSVLEEQGLVLDADRLEHVVALADGRPGYGIAIVENEGYETHAALLALMANLPRLDISALHNIGDKLARAGAETKYVMGMTLFRDFIGRAVRARAKNIVFDTLGPAEQKASTIIHGSGSLEQWVSLWENTGAEVERSLRLNLDKKQVLIDTFTACETLAKVSSPG